jgi:27-O-demethylrifamycin SV methyltransferase
MAPTRDLATSHNSQLYDRVAEGWRLLMGEDLHWGYFTEPALPLERATRELVLHLAGLAELAPGASVLDVGCGRGEAACVLAEKYGCVVTGIAPSAACVAIASEKARARGLAERVGFSERDGTATGFAAGSFDRVLILESSHLMDVEKLAAESARVLARRGRVALCDMILRRPIAATDLRDLDAASALFRPVFGVTRLHTLDELAASFARHGLRASLCDDVSERMTPTLARWRENADRRRAEVDARIEPGYAAAFLRAVDALEGLWSSGLSGYGILVAEKA